MPLRALALPSSCASGGQVVLRYLTERDHPWLRALIDEYERGIGTKRTELLARLREPLTVPAPKSKQRLAAEVLMDLSSARVVAAVPPRDARGELFLAAAALTTPRSSLLRAVAEKLGTDAESLEASLFADLASEGRAGSLPADISPSRVCMEANLRLVSSWLRRARSVRLTAWGNTRALVRQARLHGLICNVRRAPGTADDGVDLEVSGPLSLFRHTSLYARALCALVPRALWCSRFELSALCEAGPGLSPTTLVVRSGDPLPAGHELRPFDSKLEERFAKDFRKAARDWDVAREPRPLESGGSLLFPDFELVNRRDPQRRFLLEIVGFWTPQYLEAKLRRLREAKFDNVILCVDEARGCSDAELPEQPAIVRYRRRIDVAKILALLEAQCATPLARSML